MSRPASPNAAAPLTIPTYDGKGETAHLKALYFPGSWMGYPYWMVHTPYPRCHNKVENPWISVSYDRINRFDPPGVDNPVSGLPTTFHNYVHYSDGHLLMQGDIMELWFRHNGGQDPARNADNDGARILRMVSADGIHWSEPKEMIPKQGRKPLLSPAVIWEKGFYTTHDGKLYRAMSPDGSVWSKEEAMDLDYPAIKGGVRT